MQFQCSISGGRAVRTAKGVAEYIFILLGMRSDAPASANTIRAFLPSSLPYPPPLSPHAYGKLIRARPAGNPFSFGKYLKEKLKFDSKRSGEGR